MKVKVHIEELVLEGLDRKASRNISDALAAHLASSFATQQPRESLAAQASLVADQIIQSIPMPPGRRGQT